MSPSERTPDSGGAERRIGVSLGDRSYHIIIRRGLIGDAGRLLKPILARPRAFVVTDENVAPLYLAPLKSGLEGAGISVEEYIVAPGETSKSMAALERLLEWLLDRGVERPDCILALGGGVIGDLAGFAAAIVKRGCAYVQIPTTLLAQVDSAVGGKTGVNAKAGKNLIGAFHQPRLVLSDTGALATLPPREFRAGLAEVVKYGLIDNAEFFAWLEPNLPALLAQDAEALGRAIEICCRAKAAIVAADEREGGARMLLNLGHTFGHALEAAAAYDGRLLHGEAVAIGCVLAFELSAEIGLCPPGDAERVRRIFERAGLPTDPVLTSTDRLDAERFIALMRHDKKSMAGGLRFILARGIGRAFVADDVDPSQLRNFLSSRLSALSEKQK
ncbi:MAG: 3-dehydroquinate synthase [Parvularculaceae bacterium]